MFGILYASRENKPMAAVVTKFASFLQSFVNNFFGFVFGLLAVEIAV